MKWLRKIGAGPWSMLQMYCSLRAVSKPVSHIPLLCVQWKTPDDGQRNCPKHVEFYSKNKFEKLLHLVGFVLRRSTCPNKFKSVLNNSFRSLVVPFLSRQNVFLSDWFSTQASSVLEQMSSWRYRIVSLPQRWHSLPNTKQRSFFFA